MVIAAPNNNRQVVRWLERKGSLCFEVTFFATAALFFVAFSAIIIAVSLVVGGLFVAGVVLFGAADVHSLKVNKVAPPGPKKVQKKEMTEEKDPKKQDEALNQEHATEQEAAQKKGGAPRQDDAQKQDSPKRPRKKMRKRMKQMKQKTTQPNSSE